jgi:hypothetical protein
MTPWAWVKSGLGGMRLVGLGGLATAALTIPKRRDERRRMWRKPRMRRVKMRDLLSG